jgi:hypothetical protein
LQLFKLDKVSHDSLALKSFFYEKISKTKKILHLKMTEKNSLQDGPTKSISIFTFEIPYFKSSDHFFFSLLIGRTRQNA